MAQQYNLQPNEVVLLKESGVANGGRMAPHVDELILTNLNLILLKKGWFGNSKGVLRIPISQIKVHKQQAQAMLTMVTSGMPVLEVYFLNGQEQFAFQSGGKKMIHKWVTKINYAVTGQDVPSQHGFEMALPGAEIITDMLSDTVGMFKSVFGSKPSGPVNIAGKCPSCGAPASGFQGQTIRCEYCGSAQQL